MQTSKIVTEVVEIPLGVPFAEFLRIFQLALLPVLLAEPGVLSVRTGKRTRDFPIPLQLIFVLRCQNQSIRGFQSRMGSLLNGMGFIGIPREVCTEGNLCPLL